MNDKTIYISGQLFYLLTLFILNTVSARLLGPVQMGIWNLVNLIAEYGFIATLGTINGMAREIPLGIGREDLRDVENVTFNALIANVSIVTLLLVGSIFFNYWANSNTIFYVMGILLLISRVMNSFAYILIRSWQNFTYLGVQQLSIGIVQLLCLLFLLWYQSLSAVLVMTVIPLFAGSFFSLKYLRGLRGPKLDFKVMGRLISNGFPIYIIGLLFSLFATTDRLLITSFLGVKALGLYTPAIIAVSIISLAPTFVANIMYPKLTVMYGRTNNYVQIKPYLRKMMAINVSSTLLLSVALFIGFKLVIIPYLLPDYAAGLYPMGIQLLAAIVASLGHGYGDFFNAIGKQRIFLINVICGLVVNAATGFLLLRYVKLELMSVSLGTLFAVMVYSRLQVLSARKVLNEL